MKKVAVIILSIILVLSVCSCGGNSNIKQAEATTFAMTTTASNSKTPVTIMATKVNIGTSKTDNFAKSTALVSTTVKTTAMQPFTLGHVRPEPYRPTGYEYKYNMSADEFIQNVLKDYKDNQSQYNQFVKYFEENYIQSGSIKWMKLSFDGKQYIMNQNDTEQKLIDDSSRNFMNTHKISKINVVLYEKESEKTNDTIKTYMFTFGFLSNLKTQVEFFYYTNPEYTDVFSGTKILSGRQWKFKVYKQ